MAASASFQIDPGTGVYGTAGVAQNVSAGGATVNCRLVSVNGIDPSKISWSIIGTHDSSAAKPTITLSGTPTGQIASFTVPAGVGQAYGIQCEVNGGPDIEGNTAATRAKSAVYVLTTNGDRLFFIGETFEENATHATVERLNALMTGGSTADSQGDWKDSVRIATTAALAANTRSGNVLTASANGAFAAVDGVTLALNEHILVKNEGTGANNGIFTLTQVGDGSNPWKLTRRTDADTDSEMTSGVVVPVTEGTLNGDKLYQLTTNDPITLNTTALIWSVSNTPALSAVLSVGNTTGGTDIDVTAGDNIDFQGEVAIQRQGVALLSTTGVAAATLAATLAVTGANVAIGTTPATTGTLRLPNAATIQARNAANLADLEVIQLNASDAVVIGEATVGATAMIAAAAGGHWWYLGGSGTDEYAARLTTLAGDVLLQPQGDFGGAGSNAEFVIQATQRTADATDNGMNARLHAGQGGATSGDGGHSQLRAGAKGGTGVNGRCQLLASGGGASLELLNDSVSSGNTGLILALLAGAAVTSTQLPVNTGNGVIYISNRVAAPSANAVGGALLWAESGGLRMRDTGGVICDLGPNLTTTTGYVSIGATPASAGDIRLGNTDTIQFRNAANSADVTALSVNASDETVVGDGADAIVIGASNAEFFVDVLIDETVGTFSISCDTASSGNGVTIQLLGGTDDGLSTGGSVFLQAGGGNTDGAVTLADANGNSVVKVTSTGAARNLGFYGNTPVGQPTVTGSRGGNAALADLLTELDTLGLIIDSSS